MPRRLIIDGYSLLYRDDSLARLRPDNMRLAREQLIRKIDRLSDALAPVVELVFDGRASSRERIDTGHLQIIYSPGDKTADTVIEQMVHTDAAPADVCVVTSDRLECDTVSAAGAQVMSCLSFLEWLDRLGREVVRHQKKSAPSRRFTLGDMFPEK